MEALIPLFWTFGDISGEWSPIFTSGVIPAKLLMVSMVVGHFSPHACFSRGRIPDSIGRPPA